MSEDLHTLTVERVASYLDITRRARAKATPLVEAESPEGMHLATMMRMADDYASDAQHFLTTGDLVRAFGAINYAHAWIDYAPQSEHCVRRQRYADTPAHQPWRSVQWRGQGASQTTQCIHRRRWVARCGECVS